MKIEVTFIDTLDNKVALTAQMVAPEQGAAGAVQKWLRQRKNLTAAVRSIKFGAAVINAVNKETGELVAQGEFTCNIFSGQTQLNIHNL